MHFATDNTLALHIWTNPFKLRVPPSCSYISFGTDYGRFGCEVTLATSDKSWSQASEPYVILLDDAVFVHVRIQVERLPLQRWH